ncbi:MAG: hypothetical protein KAT29_08980 [Anaerolineales bacterium]|nr:hypothetical protein [Anaerolineales bacterium]
MSEQQEQCLKCGRESGLIPLLQLLYKGQSLWICPQHLPILIHKPAKLNDLLPGIEQHAADVDNQH